MRSNPFEGMLIKQVFITDDNGYTRRVYKVYNNDKEVEVNGKSEFRDDNEAERAFLKSTGRKRL